MLLRTTFLCRTLTLPFLKILLATNTATNLRPYGMYRWSVESVILLTKCNFHMVSDVTRLPLESMDPWLPLLFTVDKGIG